LFDNKHLKKSEHWRKYLPSGPIEPFEMEKLEVKKTYHPEPVHDSTFLTQPTPEKGKTHHLDADHAAEFKALQLQTGAWNERFLHALKLSSKTGRSFLQKYSELTRLMKDFEHIAVQWAQIVVMELKLPDKLKSLRHVRSPTMDPDRPIYVIRGKTHHLNILDLCFFPFFMPILFKV